MCGAPGNLSVIADKLRSISARNVLIVFWVGVAVSTGAMFVPDPLSQIASGIGQAVALFVWFGYPVAVVHCFASGKFRHLASFILVLAVITGFSLTALESMGRVSEEISALGSVLILSAFAAGAAALTAGEKRAHGASRMNVLVSAFEFFGLPFFGAHLHSRVRGAIDGIQASRAALA